MKVALYLCAVGDRFVRYAAEAAARWRQRMPEISIAVMGKKTPGEENPTWTDGQRACWRKLHLWDVMPADVDAVIYADLDVLPVRCMKAADLMHGVDLAVARDRWDDPMVREVCGFHGLPFHTYFNAGLMAVRRTQATVEMFERAKVNFSKPGFSWWDQTALNVERHRMQIPTAWLPWRCNAMDLADNVMPSGCVHAHAPWAAWRCWETGETPWSDELPGPPTVWSGLDFSHPWVTDRGHLRTLWEQATNRRHVLEVGTFQGHAAWTMAAAGSLVTTLDPGHKKDQRKRWMGLSIDCVATTGEAWLKRDAGGVYDMIFHDAEHGPRIIPELRQWWDRLLPGGALAVHDAELLEGWVGQDLEDLDEVFIQTDSQGRDLMVLTKEDADG